LTEIIHCAKLREVKKREERGRFNEVREVKKWEEKGRF
jgi:hypothetical protein